jgi:hypothetical protein
VNLTLDAPRIAIYYDFTINPLRPTALRVKFTYKDCWQQMLAEDGCIDYKHLSRSKLQSADSNR